MHLADQTSSDVIDLFHQLQATFPSKTLGEDKWYLIAISALTGSGKTYSAAQLYLYLIEQPEYASSEARKMLMQRMREALVKCVSVMGVCRPLEAVFCIDAVTKEEDRDFSCSRFVGFCPRLSVHSWQTGSHCFYPHTYDFIVRTEHPSG